MCKFHQDIALDVATRHDGSVDLAAFAVNALALGTHFSIGNYVTAMPGISGYNTYMLASRDGQQAFRDSGLRYDPDAFALYRAETNDFLRAKTQEALNLNPIRSKTFSKLKNIKYAVNYINAAPDEAYKPFDDLSPDLFRKKRHARDYQSLRVTAAALWQDNDVRSIMEERFKQSVATIFSQAPEKANPTLLRGYEAMPDIMKKYSACAGGICSSVGGNLLGHAGCIAKMAVLPALGMSSGILHDPLVTGGVMAAGSAIGIGAWHYMHDRIGTVPTKLDKMITYGTNLVILGGFMAWHQFGHAHDHHHDHPSHKTHQTIIKDEGGNTSLVRESIRCAPSGEETVLERDTIPIWYPQ